jgi:hypothetical protein
MILRLATTQAAVPFRWSMPYNRQTSVLANALFRTCFPKRNLTSFPLLAAQTGFNITGRAMVPDVPVLAVNAILFQTVHLLPDAHHNLTPFEDRAVEL